MNRFFYFFHFIFSRDILSQSRILSLKKIPKIKKIFIQFSFKDSFFQCSLFGGFISFIIELVTFQKPSFSFSKKDVSFWRVRKKNVVSLVLCVKKEFIFFILEKIQLFYFSKIKPFIPVFSKIINQKPVVSFCVRNFCDFNDFGREKYRLHRKKIKFKVFNLTVTVVFINHCEQSSFFRLLQSLLLPIEKKC